MYNQNKIMVSSCISTLSIHMYINFYIKCLNFWHLLGLYRKIVSCVLLRSGLGSPTDITVVREATGNPFWFRFQLKLCLSYTCT